MNVFHRQQMGNSLIEIIIAMGLVSVFALAFMQMTLGSRESGKQGQTRTEAVEYARQGLEAVRSLGRQNFASLSVGTHGISISGNVFTLSGSQNTSGVFTRTVQIALVQRDANGDIVQSGGSVDYDTRYVTSTVTWMMGDDTRQVVLDTYLTNWTKPFRAGLTVQKLVVNHGGSKAAGDFAPFQVCGEELNNDDPPVLVTVCRTATLGESLQLAPNTYTVSEVIDTNYTQSFSNDCNSVGSITLDPKDIKTCTITNEEKAGSVTVSKTVINHGGTKTVADFAPYKVGEAVVTQGVPTFFPNGTYAVTETTDPNYTTTFSGDCDVSGNVTVTTGSAKTCTITNEESAPATGTITVNKVVINHGGSKTAADFAPYKVGTATVTEGASTSFAQGVYVVSETIDPSYTQTFSGDCDLLGSIVLLAGESKTCTITNEEHSDGIFIYGEGSTTPFYRMYNATENIFSSQNTGPSGGDGRTFQIRTSPTKREAIAGYVSATGVLQVLCFNGTSWVNEWSATVGGTAAAQRFDIAYETASGDAMVLYSRNVGTTNELGYRTKAGSASCGSGNWSAATTLDPVRTSGVVHWVKMASDRRSTSNLITAIWADANSDLSAMVWSGTAWGNEPATTTETSLEIVSSSQDVDSFDVEYESLSGDVMIVWGNSAGSNGTNGVRYRTCTGGIALCVWGAVTTPPTFKDDATHLDISANPLTDEIVFASIGNAGSDMQAGYWSGTAWTNKANVETSCTTPEANEHLVETAWLVSGTTARSIIVYHDKNATRVGWYVGNGGTFTKQSDFNPTPTLNKTQGWYDLSVNTTVRNRVMFTLSSATADVFAKRLEMTAGPTFTWTDANGGSALTSLSPQITSSPFSFAYWKQ